MLTRSPSIAHTTPIKMPKSTTQTPNSKRCLSQTPSQIKPPRGATMEMPSCVNHISNLISFSQTPPTSKNKNHLQRKNSPNLFHCIYYTIFPKIARCFSFFLFFYYFFTVIPLIISTLPKNIVKNPFHFPQNIVNYHKATKRRCSPWI